MARRDDSLFEIMLRETARAPWPVGIVVAGVVYVGFAFLLPGMFDGPVAGAILAALQPIAHWLALPFLICSAVSAFQAMKNRKLLNTQTSIESVRALSWRDFERLLGEAFRRQGYEVTDTGQGADGGVDLVLARNGIRSYVQAKQWRTTRVGVTIVRELYGVVQADGVMGGIVVTSGSFTKEALEFANRTSIKLIDGDRLARMIDSVSPSEVAIPGPVAAAPQCPTCGDTMILRTARKGTNTGQQFWGCRGYPKCRGTRQQ